MNIRFFNCRILTMEDGKDIIDGELQVQKGKITYMVKRMEKEYRISVGTGRSIAKRIFLCQGSKMHIPILP